LKQHEEVLYALAMLNEKKEKCHSRSASAGAAGGAVCRLNLEFEADDRHCDSPDTDVYSEFNSPRSRLEAADLKLPGRRRFATEPRRTVSGRHGIPGHQEESSAESETEGAGKNTTKVKIGSSSPKQRKFSNVPPLNLAKISSAVITPRSYGSETATTRSSPDRSRNCSMRLSSHGAFNPLSNRSVRSGISSSRSLLSLSSLGAVLDDGKDNVSFASEMPSEASTATSNRAQVTAMAAPDLRRPTQS